MIIISLPLFGSLIKQQRWQWQRKRHLKINIWEMVTILQLLVIEHAAHGQVETLLKEM